jgi:hypothetical protein
MAAHLWMSALLLSGCASGGTMTIVQGSLQPEHFQFVTVVPKTEPGADGWRAACVHVPIRRAAGEPYLCTLGVEMPLENEKGPISTEWAQERSARCANLAAQFAFEPITPTTPLVLACQSFKNAYDAMLREVIVGARVRLQCHARTIPVQVGP